MTVQVTYPGVYIEELPPAGPPAIAGVPTSLTAFLGRAPVGPIDKPRTITSFGDYSRFYGGLAVDCPMSYAVNDFFNNGGSEAVIGRLFEPAPGKGDGVARLPFPPSPPLLPEGWQLAATAKTGATTISVQGPTTDEGEPMLGMTFTLGGAKTSYTVTSYTTAPTGKTIASIDFTPPIVGAPGATLPICTPTTFDHGPAPADWVVSEVSSSTLTATSGTGIPDMGDTLTIAGADGVFVIQAQPKVTPDAKGVASISMDLSPAPTTAMPGQVITISPPAPSLPAVNWRIDSYQVQKAPYTLDLINGQNAPLPGDTFTVGAKSDKYIVVDFTPGSTDGGKLTFELEPSATMPSKPDEAFCFCCPVRFTRPPPKGWEIAKGAAKAGDTSMTLKKNTATTGVIDVGHTFKIAGDDTVYTIVIFNPSTLTADFLPQAKKPFSTTDEITISPPLMLTASNPGDWGNALTAAVDDNGINKATVTMVAEYQLEKEDLFNLTLTQKNAKGKVVATEKHMNVSVRTDGVQGTYPNRLDRVLKNQSNLARVGFLSMTPPVNGSAVLGTGGNNGTNLSVESYLGDSETHTGIYILDHIPIFNLLCIPPDQRAYPDVPLAMQDLDPTVQHEAAMYCTDRRAIYIVDPPAAWAEKVEQGDITEIDPTKLQITGNNASGEEVARNAAIYFPRLLQEDPLMKNQLEVFAPSGAIAGAIAANDVARGVWTAPAGVQAGLANVPKFEVNLNDKQNGVLNPIAINCLREFPLYGPVVWGARTMMGATQLDDEYKYLNVRRLTLYIESSLYYGTQWAVFQDNNEALWSSLRLSVNNFLAGLAKQQAFYSYSVTCDASTTTPEDIEQGIVNILVKIAPVKPAEFVVIQIQQIAPTTS